MTNRPAKRPRTREPGNDETEHDTQRLQLHLRLKAQFEGIFEKYGKDFSGIGDEIDLQSGLVAVDNGHLTRMRDERDTAGGKKASKSRGAGRFAGSHSVTQNLQISGLDSTTVPESIRGRSDTTYLSTNRQGDDSDGIDICSPATERAQPTDPKWAAPDIPGLQPSPTPIIAKLPEQHRDSRRSESPGFSVWAISQPNCRLNHANAHADVPWTPHASGLLAQLRRTSNLTYTQLQRYFPGRSKAAIRAHWRSMVEEIQEESNTNDPSPDSGHRLPSADEGGRVTENRLFTHEWVENNNKQTWTKDQDSKLRKLYADFGYATVTVPTRKAVVALIVHALEPMIDRTEWETPRHDKMFRQKIARRLRYVMKEAVEENEEHDRGIGCSLSSTPERLVRDMNWLKHESSMRSHIESQPANNQTPHFNMQGFEKDTTINAANETPRSEQDYKRTRTPLEVNARSKSSLRKNTTNNKLAKDSFPASRRSKYSNSSSKPTGRKRLGSHPVQESRVENVVPQHGFPQHISGTMAPFISKSTFEHLANNDPNVEARSSINFISSNDDARHMIRTQRSQQSPLLPEDPKCDRVINTGDHGYTSDDDELGAGIVSHRRASRSLPARKPSKTRLINTSSTRSKGGGVILTAAEQDKQNERSLIGNLTPILPSSRSSNNHSMSPPVDRVKGLQLATPVTNKTDVTTSKSSSSKARTLLRKSPNHGSVQEPNTTTTKRKSTTQQKEHAATKDPNPKLPSIQGTPKSTKSRISFISMFSDDSEDDLAKTPAATVLRSQSSTSKRKSVTGHSAHLCSTPGSFCHRRFCVRCSFEGEDELSASIPRFNLITQK